MVELKLITSLPIPVVLIFRSVRYHVALLGRLMRSRVDRSVAKLSGSPRLE